MPGALAEVGSITLREEHDLLASADGQEAIARGLFEGLAAYFETRPLAARIGPEAESPGDHPEPRTGVGPPFVAPAAGSPELRLRLTNTGTAAWPSGMAIVAGWEATELPYLPQPPAELVALDPEVPALEPGESVVVSVDLPAPPEGRAVAWVGLRAGSDLLADSGSPALQVSSQPD
jgi:hypothetical protein